MDKNNNNNDLQKKKKKMVMIKSTMKTTTKNNLPASSVFLIFTEIAFHKLIALSRGLCKISVYVFSFT